MKKAWHYLIHKHPRYTFGVLLVLGLWYAFCLPSPLFTVPYSLILEDVDEQLLGARIAEDGQWRFPPGQAIPERFEKALLEFEDQRFYAHWGIDLRRVGGAMWQNIRARRIVSGASTLSMQVIRMANERKGRSWFRKIGEIIVATRLELGYSKKEILSLYCAHAPFGGNVVGLEAASWRYFGKEPELLSWAEAATLAVLPNSPGLIHPGRNRQQLHTKRDRLLGRLLQNGILDSLSWSLALQEPLPEEPHALPRLAPQLLDRAWAEHRSGEDFRIQTSVDAALQIRVNEVLERHHRNLRSNGIHNLAALVLDVETGQVRAYAGNVQGAGAQHGEHVDLILAPRSTGSILKPLLYTLMLQSGTILPESLVPDVPSTMQGFRPQNFHGNYDGVVSARKALIRSLNIPFVYMLQQYGVEKFHFMLRKLGMRTLVQPPSHYGLPLILGGAEGRLWDLCGIYASMARTLQHFQRYQGEYDPDDFRAPTYLRSEPKRGTLQPEPPLMEAASIFTCLEGMRALERPSELGDWQRFQSSQSIAWKTGTSIGFRDAWAIGITQRYVVGVWVGNASGEGRPGLTGILAAAPVMFDLFQLLPATPGWFEPPYDELRKIPVCSVSGYLPQPYCPQDSVWVPKAGLQAPACKYHRLVHLNASKTQQVNSRCASPSEMHHVPWFVLPPVEEHFYRDRDPNYRTLPPWHPDCLSTDEQLQPMQMIYPHKNTQIILPRNLDGSLSSTVFQAAHRQPQRRILWHLNQQYIGETRHFHTMELQPSPGKHTLTLVDEAGYRLEIQFEVLSTPN